MHDLNSYQNTQDTIFSAITSKLSGSVCVYRISGNRALEFYKITSYKKNQPPHGSSLYLNIYSTESLADILDQVLIIYFKSPRSFTGEDVVEVSLHNSPYITHEFEKILKDFFGFRQSVAGEFLYRAFVNQKISIDQANAVDLLIKSQTKKMHGVAIRSMSSENNLVVKKIKDDIFKILCLIEANIDFSDQEIPNETVDLIAESLNNIKLKAKEVIASNDVVGKIKNGINVCIIGSPNAGKSSLINAIYGEKVSIVSEKAGTTRDVVSKNIIIGGYSVNLFDTAGIRDGSIDDIEEEGILMARDVAKNADIRIFLFEPNSHKQDYSVELLEEFLKDGDFVIQSKNDMISGGEFETFKSFVRSSIGKKKINITSITVLEKNSILSFIDALIGSLDLIVGTLENCMILSDRQCDFFNKAFVELDSIDLSLINQDLEIIAEILRVSMKYFDKVDGFGKSHDDLLGSIFSNFCIGK
jgi:tRNA modification GTPase